jgi:hsp70-interacting protein
MKNCMAVISAADSTHDAKLTAFDELELLVESIDNAKDLGPLGLWPGLVKCLQSPPGHHEAESDEIKFAALWVMGTAVQNTPSVKKAVSLLMSVE